MHFAPISSCHQSATAEKIRRHFQLRSPWRYLMPRSIARSRSLMMPSRSRPGFGRAARAKSRRPRCGAAHARRDQVLSRCVWCAANPGPDPDSDPQLASHWSRFSNAPRADAIAPMRWIPEGACCIAPGTRGQGGSILRTVNGQMLSLVRAGTIPTATAASGHAPAPASNVVNSRRFIRRLRRQARAAYPAPQGRAPWRL
jgi:hypothetical protein